MQFAEPQSGLFVCFNCTNLIWAEILPKPMRELTALPSYRIERGEVTRKGKVRMDWGKNGGQGGKKGQRRGWIGRQEGKCELLS